MSSVFSIVSALDPDQNSWGVGSGKFHAYVCHFFKSPCSGLKTRRAGVEGSFPSHKISI